VYASDFRPTIGTGTLASHASTGTYIAIDTTVPGFGPLTGSFDTAGGYPYSTVVHEEGHLLGLGHAGPITATSIRRRSSSAPTTPCCGR
jgi:hypothetical protein